MFTKTGLLALCAAASFNGATAAHHRHRHPKRDVVYAETDVVVVTEYETHTVTAGQEQATTVPTTAVSTSSQVAAENVPVVVPTSSETPAAPTTPTTLATFVKPSSATPSTAVSSSAAEAPLVAPAAATAAQLVSSIVGDITSTPIAAPAAVDTASVAPAALPTSAAAPAEVSPASTTSSNVSKRGAAYNDASMVKVLLGQTNAISWVYNWGADAGDLGVDIPFYPTMWGDKVAADWPAKAQAAVDAGTEVFFSFNEPDNAGQANMAPSYAATKHQEWMNPYGDKARIGAPAVSSSEEANQGLDWLQQFFDACGGNCKVDFCNTHWYGPGGDSGADLFLAHVKAVRDVSGCQGKPVWITEFMPQGSSSENETFMKKITEALESSDYDFVEKYSYFMLAVGETYLMSSATELNALGKIYANLS
ncbi:hypothetical protein SLS62_010081 [Diatrype stigma]|uniref:Asl1-like glycosyl hydrolase catalytic domain-containing protein n=1 Tax=Diatrype stigma TaxID=117547 RepID=A0AAN9YJ06_9PEZI